jgi:hypothetical protein
MSSPRAARIMIISVIGMSIIDIRRGEGLSR